MIVADTNVLSEPLRVRPNPEVLAWLERHTADLFITAITVGELLTGVRALPEGRRRAGLHADWHRVFAEAAVRGKAIELDATPARQDLSVELARIAVDGTELSAIEVPCVHDPSAVRGPRAAMNVPPSIAKRHLPRRA